MKTHGLDKVTRRKQHEAATGERANMRQLGFEVAREGAEGFPLHYRKVLSRDGPLVTSALHLSRNKNKQWYVSRVDNQRYQKFPTRRVIGDTTFPGPVAAAMWLSVGGPSLWQ